MAERIRGMSMIDPPPGGLDQLRRALRRDESQSRWMSLMPWAATAILLLVTAGPMLADSLQTSRAGEEATDRIVASVREQETGSLAELVGSRKDVRVYLARLSAADTSAGPAASPPER